MKSVPSKIPVFSAKSQHFSDLENKTQRSLGAPCKMQYDGRTTDDVSSKMFGEVREKVLAPKVNNLLKEFAA